MNRMMSIIVLRWTTETRWKNLSRKISRLVSGVADNHNRLGPLILR